MAAGVLRCARSATRGYLWAIWVVGAVLPLCAGARDLRLLEAVKRRDEKVFDALLSAKADVNGAQADGATALAWAVYLGERRMAEALLDAGATVNTSDEYGETPVTLAAANGDAGLLRRLLAAGGRAQDARWNGETAVMIAAGTGSLDAVRELVRNGADVNTPEPRGGQTALMWAAAEGHRDVVAGLVEMGAHVNAASRAGFTPLVFAAVKGDVPSINTLLAAGADPNVVVKSGAKPLIVAMQFKQTAAGLALLEAGADFDGRDRAGQTALHLAAEVGDIKLVRALLDSGADPNARTTKSAMPAGGRGGGGGRGRSAGEQTPLMMAARGDHEDVMRALVAAGGNPNLKAQDGTSVLMAAAAGARLATFKYAYEIDPNVDGMTTAGDTIMHVAVAINGRTQAEVCEVIQFLADHGAELDALNNAGRTPIAIADNLPVDLAVTLLTKLIVSRGGVPKIPSKR
ncbi:MAG TPA: ankyrin repeat domain-containing protein [Vicinamibacterales bacterium]|nr:ankyrin repeat domain-containing protein [Vicinamibacterales bacterium]